MKFQFQFLDPMKEILICSLVNRLFSFSLLQDLNHITVHLSVVTNYSFCCCLPLAVLFFSGVFHLCNVIKLFFLTFFEKPNLIFSSLTVNFCFPNVIILSLAHPKCIALIFLKSGGSRSTVVA